MSNVTALYRYPVKSMGGHQLTSTNVTLQGIPGDRAWTLKDEERGSIKGGKRFPALMGMNASFVSEPDEHTLSPNVVITLADGQQLQATDQDANERLSAVIGSPVSIWPLLPADQLDHYRREPPKPGTDREAAFRELFARTRDEPLPDLSQFPAELFEFESPLGTYFDAFPLLVMSQQSLDSIAAANAASNFDIRRFRPNILLDMSDDKTNLNLKYPEQALVGKTAQLGGVKVKFEMRCPRCVMTTHGFDTLPKDPKIMRTLVRETGGDLGVYASVLAPGQIRTGDVLTVYQGISD